MLQLEVIESTKQAHGLADTQHLGVTARGRRGGGLRGRARQTEAGGWRPQGLEDMQHLAVTGVQEGEGADGAD